MTLKRGEVSAALFFTFETARGDGWRAGPVYHDVLDTALAHVAEDLEPDLLASDLVACVHRALRKELRRLWPIHSRLHDPGVMGAAGEWRLALVELEAPTGAGMPAVVFRSHVST